MFFLSLESVEFLVKGVIETNKQKSKQKQNKQIKDIHKHINKQKMGFLAMKSSKKCVNSKDTDNIYLLNNLSNTCSVEYKGLEIML